MWVREKESTNFRWKMWPWRRNKKFGKMHKFAEICLLCQKREFFTIFHHSNENGSSSANFEARPLILFANENIEQVLIFCFWGHKSSISATKIHLISWKVKVQPILRQKLSKEINYPCTVGKFVWPEKKSLYFCLILTF